MLHPSSPATPSDSSASVDDLLARIATGDSSAFGALYDHSVGSVHGFAMQLCEGRADADALTRAVFVAAWESAARFEKERGAGRVWLFSLTRRIAADRASGRPALSGLPAPHRDALALALGAGAGHKEIAECLGVPIRTARELLKAAVSMLRADGSGDPALLTA